MPKQAPLLLVAIAALAVALYFTLSSDSQADLQPAASSRVAGELGVEASPVDTELESAANAANATVAAQSEADSERAEVVTGHRLRVLNADGSPAVGVRVQAAVPSPDRAEESLAYWRDHPDTIFWGGPSAGLLPASAEGMVMLPSFETTIASVTQADRVGHLICKAREGDPNFVHTLQLRSARMIEIRVLAADGTPVKHRYRMDCYVAEAAKADALPDTASGWDRDQVWKQHMGMGNLPDGREMLSLELNSSTKERLGTVNGPLRYRLSLSGGLAEFAPREFDANETGPIVFQYPAQGRMAIQLVGFPQGAVPRLQLVTEAERAPTQGSGTLSEDGSWYEFDGLPIGEQFDVAIQSRLMTRENTERLAHTRLAPERVSGPTLPGERVEHRLEFEPPPGFYGRFVFPEKMPMSADEFAYLANRSTSSSSKILFASGRRAWDWAECSVFADGSFFVPVDRLRRQNDDIRDVGAIAFQWVQEAPAEDLRPEVWVPARIWATPSARSISLDDAVDLGDVPLVMDGPLMKVRVVDGKGEPLPGATIDLKHQRKHEFEGGLTDYFMGSQYQPGATDDLGESWILGRDWYAALGVRDPSSLSKNEAHQQLHAVRITASHPSATSASKILLVPELGRKTLEIQLSPSGSIVGSVIPVAMLPYLDIAVVPPGTEYEEAWRETGVDRAWVDFRNQRKPEDTPFEITAVPPGVWDVVFAVRRHGAEEVLRVSGVQVIANEVCKDPRLASVVLEGKIGFTRLVLRDGSGRVLDKSLGSEFDPRVISLTQGGGVGLSFQWVDEAMALPIPIGETVDLAIIATGWETLVFQAASDGEIQATMRRTQAATLTVHGLDQLPAGMQLDLTLQPGTNYFARAEWQSTQYDPSKILLRAPGEYIVNWMLKADGKYIAAAEGKVQITAAQVYSGADLVMELPQSILDAFGN
jgi:hypothetical protein